MTAYNIYLKGKFKPYVRMTRRGMWVKKEARAYLDSKAWMQYQLNSQMCDRPMLPGKMPLSVYITIGHSGGFHNRDLDNEVKAILDAMNGIVYPDDRWIDRIEAKRVPHDSDKIYIHIEELSDDGG